MVVKDRASRALRMAATVVRGTAVQAHFAVPEEARTGATEEAVALAVLQTNRVVAQHLVIMAEMLEARPDVLAVMEEEARRSFPAEARAVGQAAGGRQDGGAGAGAPAVPAGESGRPGGSHRGRRG